MEWAKNPNNPAWARRNFPQVGPDRRGAGSTPAFFKGERPVDPLM
jgi:hypothetical protein